MSDKRYSATISHSSISRARVIDAGNSLRSAKRRATMEFGNGFLDHAIVIWDSDRSAPVAKRRVADSRWTDIA